MDVSGTRGPSAVGKASTTYAFVRGVCPPGFPFRQPPPGVELGASGCEVCGEVGDFVGGELRISHWYFLPSE